MRLYLVLCFLALPLFSSAGENIELTPEQWQSLKSELQTLREYYNESESLRKEREAEYEQKQRGLTQREERLNRRESALNEREIDLELRENYQDEREKLLTESTDSLKRLKRKIEILERDKIIFQVLTGLGTAGAAAGWTAYALK